MAEIFCFNTGEDKETKLLDEKDINFQESVIQPPMTKSRYNQLLEATFIVQNMEQDIYSVDVKNYNYYNTHCPWQFIMSWFHYSKT